MPSRQSTLLLALLLQLGLCGAFLGAHAFYMPPAFDLEAVPATFPAYPAAAALEPAPHADAPNGTTGTGVAASDGGGGAFAVPGNATTADDTAMRTAAAPATLSGRDVWDPEVTAPDAATVWTVGATVTVRWKAAHPPKRATTYTGRLVLGHLEDGDDANEHLDVENPLADGFDLRRGQVQVKVPSVSPSNNYIVVLFGDSGNRSPQFTIVD